MAELEGRVSGFGALSPYSARPGYRHTVEDSLYVAPDLHGRGIGRALLADLLDRATAAGHHAVIAVIAADQAPSIALHERLGFQHAGLLREVGWKFGRWLDVCYMHCAI